MNKNDSNMTVSIPPPATSPRRRAARVVTRPLRRILLPTEHELKRFPLGLPKGLRFEISVDWPLYRYFGLSEYEIWSHVRAYCKPGYRCFDVDSADGYWSLIFSRLTQAEVVSFEPDEAPVSKLRSHLAANPREARRIRVRVTRVAAHAYSANGNTSLDHEVLACGVGRPDVVKVDVDGGEVDVLRGAEKLLRLARPHVILETHSPGLERECAEWRLERGCRPSIVPQRRHLQEHRPLEHNRWLIARGDPRALQRVS